MKFPQTDNSVEDEDSHHSWGDMGPPAANRLVVFLFSKAGESVLNFSGFVFLQQVSIFRLPSLITNMKLSAPELQT